MSSVKPTREATAAESRALRAGADHHRAFVGPPHQYDFMGATQFRLLTTLGLREEHRLLDIGCGSLRSGRLFITYLWPDRYFGIEPNGWLVDKAIREEVGTDLCELKRPSFSDNASFDYEVFGTDFDYVVAQSVFSHTGHDLLRRGITNLPTVMHDRSRACVTFIDATPDAPETPATGWIYPACVTYRRETLDQLIGEAGLRYQVLPWFHPRQTWYLLARSPDALLRAEDVPKLTGGVYYDDRFAPYRRR